MKQTLRTEYVVEKDGLYYNDQNDIVNWFSSPFYMDSVFLDKRYATQLAEKYNATVRKFIVTAEVEDE